jgi:uncharacterized protein involved in propanediol utilization
MTDEMIPVARTATCVPGHFGEWIQGRFGPEGPVVLVTLACPALCVRAPGDGPALDRLFPPRAVAGFATALGLGPVAWPGLDCDMPMGAGAGASTACLVASARAMGSRAAPEALARACLDVEGASDPLMYPVPDRMLWASREGRALEALAPPPRCEMVGGFWGAPTRTDPLDAEFPDIADLVDFWRGAVARGDRAALAGIASESARRCTALRGPDDPMKALARDLGALGHVRAHTGTARALIFGPGKVPGGAAQALAEAGLSGVMRFVTGGAA